MGRGRSNFILPKPASPASQLAVVTGLLLVLCSCATKKYEEHDEDTQAAASRVVVRALEKPFPADEKWRWKFLVTLASDNKDAGAVFQVSVRNWTTKYEIFGRALLEKAREARFDEASLERVLALVRADAEAHRLAYLPVGAFVAKLGDEPVWILELRWEFNLPQEPWAHMGHIRAYAFLQKNLEQLEMGSCD